MNKNSTSNGVIREFVQRQLGCSCPDGVFDSISISDGSRYFDTECMLYQIGGRLLVVVLAPQDWHQVCAGLEQLIEAGRHMRDQHGYNRFRLVITTGDREAESLLHRMFKNSPNTDDKMHLHVIHPRVLPSDELVHHW